MSQQSKYKNFTDWKYGYTLGPPSVNNGGAYTVLDSSATTSTPSVEKHIAPDGDDKNPDKSSIIETSGNEITITANDEVCPNTISPIDDSKKPEGLKEDTKPEKEKGLSVEEI